MHILDEPLVKMIDSPEGHKSLLNILIGEKDDS